MTEGRNHELASIFHRSYRPLCRLAYVIVGDSSAAEEVVMDALLKTFAGWRRIRDVDKADAYLKRAVINGCRARIRRRMVELKHAAVVQQESARGSSWDPDRHETGRTVWAAVSQLPERQRACVVLRYFEDLTEREIADLLDTSVGTVKSQLSKARGKLERMLGSTLGDER